MTVRSKDAALARRAENVFSEFTHGIVSLGTFLQHKYSINRVSKHIVLRCDLAHSSTNACRLPSFLVLQQTMRPMSHRFFRVPCEGEQNFPSANIEGPCVCSSYRPLLGVSFALFLLLLGGVPAYVAIPRTLFAILPIYICDVILSATLFNRRLDVPAVQWPCAVGCGRQTVYRLPVVF